MWFACKITDVLCLFDLYGNANLSGQAVMDKALMHLFHDLQD